jgi:hypothetical protein
MTPRNAFILFLLSSCSIGRAKVEYEIHTGYSCDIICNFGVSPKGNLLPVVVTVTDEDNKPVAGAVVAIKRIQPDGYSEEDVRSTKDSSTDKDGRITLNYPCGLDSSEIGKPRLKIIGAITVVADGYETTAIECETYFAGLEIPHNERSALAARVVLKKLPDRADDDPFQPDQPVRKGAASPVKIKTIYFESGSFTEELSFDWIVPVDRQEEPAE